MSRLKLLTAILLFVVQGTVTVKAQPIIETQLGSIQGMTEDGVAIFKGIPYAAPPVGELRWRTPQPAEPWSGVREATEFVHDCPQVINDIEAIQTTPSEDCLYLNVWKPASAEPGANLPVMVWIHGGGWVGGGTSIPFYDGTAFANQDIVVVSMNYRLGRLGFFAHPALLAAGEGPVGNFGYMDQIAALEWVQDNIAAFGGDPSQVTLIGQSAGGGSVLALLTSPMTEGLFSQVMVMSGGGRRALASRRMTGGSPQAPSADMIDAAFAASLGIEGSDASALAALRALSAEEVVGGIDLGAILVAGLGCLIQGITVPELAASCVTVFQGTHMIDGMIVPDDPEVILTSGGAPDVPVVIGTVALDLWQFFPPSVLDPFSYFGEDADWARLHYAPPPALIEGLVAAGQGEIAALVPILSIGADMTMHEPARFVARQMTSAGNPAWLYRFSYTAESTRPASLLGQSHSGELPFMFETLDVRYPGAVTDTDSQIARVFNSYVANFVRTGNPNGDNLPEWPQFSPDAFDLMHFSFFGPTFEADPREIGVELVERYAEMME